MKNERGYRLTSKNILYSILLFTILLSVASIVKNNL